MDKRPMAVPEFYSGKILYPAIAVLVGLSALFGLAILPRLVPQGGGMVGQPAPALALAVVANGAPGDDGGHPRMTLKELEGHPVLLDFWASWCGPCAMEAPVVDRVARRFEKRGLVVLGVNVSDPPDVVRAYANQKGLHYPMTMDADGQASRGYGVEKLPSLVVIDKQGKVLAFLTGLVDEASLNDIVAAAM
jgi:cytochrome c biogenesis protein CcmG, thiol:disulfide interchange protein DsbE